MVEFELREGMEPLLRNRKRARTQSTASVGDYKNEDLGGELGSPQKNSPILHAQSKYHGLSERSIKYSTISPPPDWIDTSRRLLPPNMSFKLRGVAELDIVSGRMIVKSHKKVIFDAAVEDVGMSIKGESKHGTLQLLKKSDENAEVLELAFATACETAQFQNDLLALQLIGTNVFNMYECFELIHRGSSAYQASEPVLHDEDFDGPLSADPSGIAWDDAMRCLGTQFNSIRKRLEQLKTWNSGDDMLGSLCSPEYVDKRKLIGALDFFRLFVPILAETTRTTTSISRNRFQKVLRWRERVCRAALLVRQYVRARIIANRGLELYKDTSERLYLQQRLSYDSDKDNHARDISMVNEYYETAMGRDMECFNRVVEEKWSYRHIFSCQEQVPSGYQGYALIASHIFQWNPTDPSFPLQPSVDLVPRLQKLHELFSSHPKESFFVNTFFVEGSRPLILMQVYVRSLAAGVDAAFDEAVSRET